MDDESMVEFKLTPKGVVMASLLETAPDLNERGLLFETTEQILERLYLFARSRADKDDTPALVFVDGHWEFAAVKGIKP